MGACPGPWAIHGSRSLWMLGTRASSVPRSTPSAPWSPTPTCASGTRAAARSSGSATPFGWPRFHSTDPGGKHERPIRLVGWQRELTRAHPKSLLAGLIHSDGSRVVNRFKTKLPSGRIASYEYVRYFFTNYSADIRRIFCEHCEQLGIRWTQSSFKNISIANRPSVAILDGFVGP
jgi:hypothetical protein